MPDLNFALPNFTSNLSLNLALVRLLREEPALFREGVRIDSVYGSFPRCRANGGRTHLGLQYADEKIRATFAALNDAGAKARLTFTNMFADEAMLRDDPYVRSILEIARDFDVEVIVYADEVADYLRENYPFGLVLSTTRGISDVETLNAALERFDYAVLDYNRNKDRDFLSRVSRPERLEVMVNELCVPGCTARKRHYEYESRRQLGESLPPFEGCKRNHEDIFDLFDGPVVLTNEDVTRLREDYGIRYFKVVGRGRRHDALLANLLYYLAAAGCEDDIRRRLDI